MFLCYKNDAHAPPDGGLDGVSTPNEDLMTTTKHSAPSRVSINLTSTLGRGADQAGARPWSRPTVPIGWGSLPTGLIRTAVSPADHRPNATPSKGLRHWAGFRPWRRPTPRLDTPTVSPVDQSQPCAVWIRANGCPFKQHQGLRPLEHTSSSRMKRSL